MKNAVAKNYLIYGISKGLGKFLALRLPTEGDRVWGISRSKPAFLEEKTAIQWVQADLSDPLQAQATIADALQDTPIDGLIYNVGIWERTAFTPDYDFEKVPAEETFQLINTNTTSAILAVQSMLPNLKKAPAAKIILIGSTWGLENHEGREVAFSASKFALRGMAHALRASLRPFQIGVTVLNLGYLGEGGTDLQKELETSGGQLIPLHDVLRAIRFVMATSYATCVKEIHMPAMQDGQV
jgi:NAD(P)-dependent dehydrogenase (short-subunit alcohol dehydrogenase family)